MSLSARTIIARALFTSLLLVLGVLRDLGAASNDDNVEWNGVLSLPTWRSPEQPARNQSFRVTLRVFKGDITAARVRTWDGQEDFWSMSWDHGDGTYDYWQATVGGTGSDYLYYGFEIRDGSRVDYFNALGMWDDPPPRGDFLINLTPLGRFPLGSTHDGAGTVFRVWAPNAASAAVAGEFNGWSTTASPMTNVQGFWQARVPAAGIGGEYKLVLDGDIWRTDPRARAQTSSVGNSVVARTTYPWSDTDWVTPYFEDMVIYELHVGSFSGEGDGVTSSPGRFRDIVDAHLEHLAGLGINMIELLPVGEFAADRSWGYNPAFLFAPESAYGSPDDLKYLVDRCHRRGIGVILDVVYNHMGPSDLAGNILEYDGEEVYFYPVGNGYRETPWGPRLDYGRVEVRNFIRDNVRYWLEEYRLDGLRVDATDFIKVNGDGWAVLKDIANEADDVSRKAIVIAEQLPNDPAVTRPIAEGGAGLDAQWNDAFHDSLRQAIQDAAFGDPNLGAVAAGIHHFALTSGGVVNYIESHDEAAHQGRICKVADASDPDGPYAYGRSKVAAALVLFSAGIPMLLQGQEFLEDRNFGDAESNRIQWRYRQAHGDFLLFMTDAVRLRRAQASLRSSSWQNVYHVNDSAGVNVLALHRAAGPDDDLVIVTTLANDDLPSYRLGFPAGGTWYEILNGDSSLYGGRNRGNAGQVTASGPPLHGLGASATIYIPRMGVLVFARRPWSPVTTGFIRADCNSDSEVDISDAIQTLGVLFLGVPQGSCPAACDANSDGGMDISDAVYTLGFLFSGGPPPAAPWPACGASAGEVPCEATCGG